MRIKGSRWWDGKEYYYIDTHKDYRIGDILKIGDREEELIVIVDLIYDNKIIMITRNINIRNNSGYATEYASLTNKPASWNRHTQGNTLGTINMPIIKHSSECYKCKYDCKMDEKCWMYEEKAG